MSAPTAAITLENCAVPLGLAVSGGSDSIALLYHASRVFEPQQLRVVTVNHGLRPAAVDEAASVERLCAGMGVAHDTLTLAVPSGPDLQARARDARYAAIAEWAKSNHLAAVALGHTQDDQAETVLMRLARGSGVDGLAAMPPSFERGGVRFLRPLLQHSRTDLRDDLQAAKLTWIDDPSNEDTRFDRVAMRQAMPDLEKLGIQPARLASTARWMQAAQVVLDQAADAWIARHAFADHTDAVLDADALSQAPEDTAFRVLTRCLCAISGNPYRPRFAALEPFRHGQGGTLHGCLVYRHKSGLRITREYQAVKDAPDPRWRITGVEGEIRALGQAGLTQLQDWRDTACLPRRSLLASPSLWRGNTLVAAPFAQPQTGVEAHVPSPFLFAN